MVGAFLKPSSGRKVKPIHSISKQYSIQTLERVYKHYYYIIRGITVNEAAKRSHIAPPALKNILYGNEENIGVVTLCKLCQGLEMTVSEFFGDEMFERK